MILPRGGVIGSGNTPPTSPPQGNNGALGVSDLATFTVGGGGGGSGGSGAAASVQQKQEVLVVLVQQIQLQVLQ
jgi:hypothetical protein